jgi:CheY-like chemotaxis protein
MNFEQWSNWVERSAVFANSECMESSRPQSAKSTVLVVEDEGIVRIDAAESLRDAGFEVVEAADAIEAMDAVESRDDIGVLFTDIDIPGGMDGLELARLVHRRRPKVCLILTSGAVRIPQEQIPDKGEFVRKPYCPDAVASTIRRMLA